MLKKSDYDEYLDYDEVYNDNNVDLNAIKAMALTSTHGYEDQHHGLNHIKDDYNEHQDSKDTIDKDREITQLPDFNSSKDYIKCDALIILLLFITWFNFDIKCI